MKPKMKCTNLVVIRQIIMKITLIKICNFVMTMLMKIGTFDASYLKLNVMTSLFKNKML